VRGVMLCCVGEMYAVLCLTRPVFSAAYYVAFGPHGPRTPTSQPGDNLKILLSTLALVGVSGAVYFAIKAVGKCRVHMFIMCT